MIRTYGEVRRDEQGFAAILVTIILLIVVSLITTGFAAQMRKEQQAALDNQLSTQAYYAAESGVNDYAKAIKSYLAAEPPFTTVASLTNYLNALNHSSCTPPAATDTVYGSLASSASLSNGVKYTCVTVDANPTQIQYSNIGSSAQIIPVVSASTIGSLVISWQPTTQVTSANPIGSCPSNVNSFPTQNKWPCQLGIVRVDLVPTQPGSSYTLQSLQGSTMTAFLVPTSLNNVKGCIRYQGGTSNPTCQGNSGVLNNQYGDTANQGAVVAAKCTNGVSGEDPSCTVTITGLSSNSYSLRISTIYTPAAVNIQGFGNSGNGVGNPVELSGAQVVVDSTGLAQDVLHRIQVRIPVGASANGDTFNAAIMSAESLCKQFQTYPGTTTDSGNCSLP